MSSIHHRSAHRVVLSYLSRVIQVAPVQDFGAEEALDNSESGGDAGHAEPTDNSEGGGSAGRAKPADNSEGSGDAKCDDPAEQTKAMWAAQILGGLARSRNDSCVTCPS